MRGPGPLETRQEVPRAALSMLSRSVGAGVDSALPVASPAGRIAGQRASPRGGGHRRISLVTRTRAPARGVSLPLRPGASLLPLSTHPRVAEPALLAQVPGTSNRPTPPA